MRQTYLYPWRFYLVAGLGCLAFAGVFARLVDLHVVEAAHLTEVAERSRRVTIPLMARRGDIVDAKGEMLASTRAVMELGIDPVMLKAGTPVEGLGALANLIGLPPAEVRQRLQDAPPTARWVKLAEVDTQTYQAALELGIEGVYGNRRYLRYYPGGDLAAHVLGFVNRDNTAVGGVEALLDFYLRGEDGWKQTERDGARRELAAFRDREVPARGGYTVQVTLDSVIQDKAREEIRHLVEKYQPEGVCIIVSEARTGKLLALANHPSFDPNEFWKYPLDTHRNRAITDVYEPGSTFKIVPVAGALEERLATPSTILDCAAPVAEYKGRQVRLPSDHITLGIIPLHEAVARSSNRGMARLGMMLGEDRLYGYSRRFGFGEETEFPLMGEVKGVLHPVKAWDGLTISRLPAGYAVSATPMQVHQAMSVIAAEGMLRPPWLLERVVDARGRSVLTFPAPQERRVVSPETARSIAAMLLEVVSTNGTARRASIAGFSAAGKTGTSRKIIDGQYSHNHHVASFSGFFPAHDPAYVITVVVDDAKGPGVAYGGTTAAPVFQALGEWLVRYYKLEPEPTLQPFFAARAGGSRP